MARPASDISERLVRAARDRFLEEGVDGASLRAIARDAGTNVGMVYYYYPTKDDLFLAVVEEVYARLVENLSQAVSAPELDTRQRIETLYARLAALSDDDVKVVRLILKEGMASSQRLSRLFERFSRGHLPLVMGMILEGVQAGEVRRDVHPLALGIATLALGLLPQILRRRLEESGVAVAKMLPEPQALSAGLAALALDGLTHGSTTAPKPAATPLAPAKKRKPKAASDKA
jgi:AcrR family transcriptional regulator